MNMIRGEVVKLTVINQIKKIGREFSCRFYCYLAYIPIKPYLYLTLPCRFPTKFSAILSTPTIWDWAVCLARSSPFASYTNSFPTLRPLFYQQTLRLFGCGRLARFGKCRFTFGSKNQALRQTDEQHRPNLNSRWIRHLLLRFVNGSRR